MEVGIAIYSSLSNAMEVVNMLQQSIVLIDMHKNS